MTGVLYYPPLRLVCIPAFLYLGIAPTHRVYVIWRQEGRFSPLAAESVLLAFCLVQGYFLVGAVGFSLYYLGQVMAEAKRQVPDARSTWQPPLWAWRQSADGEVVTLVNCLQVGDTVVVHAGEMVPLAGVVSSGTAWVRTPGSTTDPGADGDTVGMKDQHWSVGRCHNDCHGWGHRRGHQPDAVRLMHFHLLLWVQKVLLRYSFSANS
jgi:hypothetical protein